MNHEKDGMRYPSIDQLGGKTSSKYKLVMGAALRAKELAYEDEKPLIKAPYSKKPIGVALEEINSGEIVIRRDKDDEFE